MIQVKITKFINFVSNDDEIFKNNNYEKLIPNVDRLFFKYNEYDSTPELSPVETGKIWCICGSSIKQSNINRHNKSKKHISYLNETS